MRYKIYKSIVRMCVCVAAVFLRMHASAYMHLSVRLMEPLLKMYHTSFTLSKFFFFFQQRITEGFHCKSFPAALWSEPGLINWAAGLWSLLVTGQTESPIPHSQVVQCFPKISNTFFFFFFGEWYCTGRSDHSQKLWLSCGQTGFQSVSS